jgi:hypothetical protein
MAIRGSKEVNNPRASCTGISVGTQPGTSRKGGEDGGADQHGSPPWIIILQNLHPKTVRLIGKQGQVVSPTPPRNSSIDIRAGL